MRPPRIVKILSIEPFRITTLWTNGDVRVNDFSGKLNQFAASSRWAKLTDFGEFKQAVVGESDTLTWPNLSSANAKGQPSPVAFDPDVLYAESQLAEVPPVIERDLLSEWSERFRLQLVRRGSFNSPEYNDTYYFDSVIRGSFIQEDNYIVDQIPSFKNKWLSFILQDIRLHLTYFRLKELVKIIEFFNTLGIDERKIYLKDGLNNSNEEKFLATLFELEVHCALRKSDILTKIGYSYPDSSQNLRPTDGYFEYEGEKYLIECLKIENKKLMKYVKFISEFTQVLLSNHNKLNIVEAPFRFFIAFKKCKDFDNLAGDEPLKNFRKLVREFYTTYNSRVNNYINFFKPRDFDTYVIGAHSALMVSEKEFINEMSQYECSVFANGGYLSYPSFYWSFHVSGNYSITNLLDEIFTKIKNKKKQHRTYSHEKIYFIVIEDSNSLWSGLNININSTYLERSKFASLASGENNFVIINKKLTDTGYINTYTYHWHEGMNTALINIIEREFSKYF